MAQALRIPNLIGGRLLRSADDQQWSSVRTLDFPDWFKEAIDRISELARLQEGWDSYGATRVTNAAISQARFLLSNLDVEDLPRPHIAALSDGGVGFHWRIADRDLEIEIEPNGAMHYLTTIVGEEPGDAEDAKFPSDVQTALNWTIRR
jgi:hypothetical protein